MERIQNFIMRPYRTTAATCALLLLVSLLAACSAARLAYSNGETLTYWWLDSYVGFDSNQKSWVKKEIDDLFIWHRRKQLQNYVQFLKRGQSRVQAGVSETELQNDHDEIKKHILVLADRALPVLADLALSLHPEQIDNIKKKLASNNDKYRKDHLRGNLEKRQHSRYKKAIRQAAHWFGDFNSRQEQQIRALSDARPLNNELVLNDRIQRQVALIALLRDIQREKPGRNVAMTMIRSHIVAALDRSSSPEHKEFFDTFRASTIHMTAVIINSATPAQKTHFVKTTQHWIDDFSALAP